MQYCVARERDGLACSPRVLEQGREGMRAPLVSHWEGHSGTEGRGAGNTHRYSHEHSISFVRNTSSFSACMRLLCLARHAAWLPGCRARDFECGGQSGATKLPPQRNERPAWQPSFARKNNRT
jgi:hypothetical protein